MSLALFLVDQVPVADELILDGDEGRHAATVKRIKIGEQVLIGDGRGTLLTCAVTRIGRDRVELSVRSRRTVEPGQPRLVVVQALPKGERADLAIELLTELGADEIVPWAASRSVARWDVDRAAKSHAKWQRTAREAAKQSRRAWVPEVGELASTEAVAARLAMSGGFVLHEDAQTGLATVALAGAEVVLVVGPEGGISPDELAAFGRAGAAPVRLGEPVLRTSTAGAAALAAVNVRLGRWA